MTSRLPGLVLVLLACAARAHAATLCVWTNSPHPGAPYNAWTNAAREIQTAVTAAQAGDTVLVTNGLYASGSYALPTHAVSNRVLITTSIVVRSVNGPAVTVIRGRSAGESGERRCVYITGGGQLSGFTLTNGAARGGACWQDGLGGGALIEVSGTVSNCVVCSNSATYGGGIAAYYGGEVRNCLVYGNAAGLGSWFYGGGFYGSQGAAVYDSVFSNNLSEIGGGVGLEGNCRISRCVMRNNRATSGGGASMRGGDVLENCVIVSNVASISGGGISFSSGAGQVRNCTVYGNAAQQNSAASGIYCVGQGTLINSIFAQNGNGSENLPASGVGYQADHLCTMPSPSNGTGHVLLDPLLLSDYRLSSNSPCIDAGCTNGPDNDLARVVRPLDGNADGISARDIGAYEYVHPLADSDSDGLRDTNELAAGTSPIRLDTDGDGMGDSAELRAGTDALSASSFLYAAAVGPTNAGAGFLIRWPGATGKRYRVERATNASPAAFTYFVQTNVAGTAPLNVATDTTASGSGPWFYRIRLE